MQPQKLCPKCQQPATLHASECIRCGHRFRTQFVPRVIPPPLPKVNNRRGLSHRNVYTACVIASVIFVCCYGFLYLKYSTPGDESRGLARQMQSLLGQSFDLAEAKFGKPDNMRLFSSRGVWYLNYTYKRKDGEVLVSGPSQADCIENVSANREWP